MISDTEVFSLSNKLRFAIVPRHRAKLVSIQIWIQAGSVCEAADEYGIAHFIEHMLFKGTSEHGVGEVSSLIERMGGDINAYTTFDHTVVHATVLSQYANEALLLLKQAVFDSIFDADEVENERQVIIEEIKRGNDDPGSILGHKVLEQVYAGTGYARPIYGSEESVNQISRQQISNFHKRWYVPENSFVVVCGDVEPDVYSSHISEVFGEIQPQSKWVSPCRPAEGEFPKGLQLCLQKSQHQLPRIEISIPAPPIEHADAPALNLISFAIGHSENGPLAAEMRDRLGLVAAASCGYQLSSFRGMISFSLIPEVENLRTSLIKTLELISKIRQGHFLDEQIIEAAKSNFIVDRIHEEETVDGLARTLGACLLSDYGPIFEEVFEARVRRTGFEEIKAAAHRWFRTEDLAIVIQLPDTEEITETELMEIVRGAQVETRASSSTVSPYLKKVQKLDKIHYQQIDESVSFVVQTLSDTPLIGFVAAANGGLRVESSGCVGLQHAAGSMVAVSNAVQDSRSLTQAVESMGASISGFSGKDSIGMRAQFLDQDFERMSSILIDSFFEPLIETEKFETYRRQIVQTIGSEGDSPANLVMRRFQAKVFGEHPYRHPLYGNEQLLESLNASDVEAYFRKYTSQQKWILSFAGGISERQAREFSERFAAELRESKSRVVEFNHPKCLPAADESAQDHRREQVHVVIGRRGICWKDAVRPTADVISAILGGSGGRLFVELRDKSGLVYTVSPFANHGVDPGLIGVYFACQPQNVDKCLELIKTQLKSLANFEDHDDELDRAKQFILGGHEQELQRTDALAMNAALMTLYGLGHEEAGRYRSAVANVTAEAIREVASKIFAPESWIVAHAGE
jgi:zinc protease